MVVSPTVSFTSTCTTRPCFLSRRLARSGDEEEEYDDDDDDDMIDVDSLGDWRAFRRSLAANSSSSSSSEQERLTVPSQVAAPSRSKTVSRENEELLETQSRELADEYRKGVWAHETSVVRVCVCLFN